MGATRELTREWRYPSSDRKVWWIMALLGSLHALMDATRASLPHFAFLSAAGAVCCACLALKRKFPAQAELRVDRLVLHAGSPRQAVFHYADVRRVEPGRQRTKLLLVDGRVREVSHWNFLNSADVDHFIRELTARVAAAAERQAAGPTCAEPTPV